MPRPERRLLRPPHTAATAADAPSAGRDDRSDFFANAAASDLPPPPPLPNGVPPPPPPPGWPMPPGYLPPAPPAHVLAAYLDAPPPAPPGFTPLGAAAATTRPPPRADPPSTRTRRAPSQGAARARGGTATRQEETRIRGLATPARDFFAKAGVPRASTPGAAKQPPRSQPPAAEWLRQRREHLINAHRCPHAVRQETVRRGGSRPRAAVNPGPSRQAATPLVRKVKRADVPDLGQAMRDGVRPRHADPTALAPTLVEAQAVLGQAEGEPRAEDYLHGIEDLYHRMRDAYTSFQRGPDSLPSLPAVPAPEALPAVPAAPGPSSEARLLHAELDRLERQWQRLADQQQARILAAEQGSPEPEAAEPAPADLDRAAHDHVRSRKALVT